MSIATHRTDNNINESSIYTFAGDTKRETKVVPKLTDLTLSIEGEEASCRICLETSPISQSFIHPCKCSGSVKYVHEECLKTWLVSLGKDLDLSKCELCQTKYLMKYILKRKCLPQESCKTGAAHCLFIPILIAVMLMLFLIVYLLAQKYFTDNSSSEQQAYTIALTLTCLIAGLIIVVLIINSIKEACYAPKLEDWKILTQNFAEETRREVTPEAMSKFEEMRKKTLIIPKSLRLKGKRVRVPILKPMLTPVNRSGRVVAFSPKYFTPVGHSHPQLTDLNPLDDSFFKFERNIRESRFSDVELLKK